MKRYIAFVISFVLLVCVSLTAYAHPGSLDKNGGHYNRQTGEYHYHDGDHTETPAPKPSPTTPERKEDQRSTLSHLCEIIITLLYIPAYSFSFFMLAGIINDFLEKIFLRFKSQMINYICFMRSLCVSALIVGYAGQFVFGIVNRILFNK